MEDLMRSITVPAISYMSSYILCYAVFSYLNLDALGVPAFFRFLICFTNALEGFIFTSKFGRKQNVISRWKYFQMSSMSLLIIIFDGFKRELGVSTQMENIFYSMIVFVIVIMSKYSLKIQYPSRFVYVAALVVCYGLFTCNNHISQIALGDEYVKYSLNKREALGILCLTFVVFLSSRLAIFQEELCIQYGKHPSEARYYTNLFTVPIYVPVLPVFYYKINLFSGNCVFTLFETCFTSLFFFVIFFIVVELIKQRSKYVLVSELTAVSIGFFEVGCKALILLGKLVYWGYPYLTSKILLSYLLIFLGIAMYVMITPIKQQKAKKAQD